MNAQKFLEYLRTRPTYREQAVHIERLEGHEAEYADLEPALPAPLQNALGARGITRLYSHQVECVQKLRQGKNVAVVTSTASGKSLCYHLPAIENLLADPSSKALYIYPTKALAQDQLRGLLRFQEAAPEIPLVAGAYDGDTPPDTRKKLRERGNIILTNPDMLHQGILPKHPGWAPFLANLKYVVIDEIHSYRGVFGSNVANVIRRLRRICRQYGADPQFICCSATIANPGELCERITGLPVEVVDHNGAPRGPRSFVLWNPPNVDITGTERRSSNHEAAELLCELVRARHATIAFGRARIVAELLFRYSQEILQRTSPSLARAIRPYRGGYLPAERREIERMLFEGELLGVTSTNALELGIDIGALEACIIVGYPGTIASTWQQAGRAGRGQDEAVVFFVAHNAPIDQYLTQNPRYFFGRNPENAVVDPSNPHVLLGHLRAAAFERPLAQGEVEEFGEYAPALMEILAEDRQIQWDGRAWRWTGSGFPATQVNLRNMSDNTFTIVDTTSGNRVIGSLDEPSAYQQVYEQAIYIHEGETYFVRRMDTVQRVAYVEKADVDYYTQSITEVRINIEEKLEETGWGESKLCHGDVHVTVKPYMFRKIKFGSRDSIGYGKIDLEPQVMETVATWLMPSKSALAQVREFGRDPMEGLLGIANVLVEVLPLFSMCDTSDIGSVVDMGNTGYPTVFVYDKYPGGLGFARRAYDSIEAVLQTCRDLIAGCTCRGGCPSCVGSPIPPHAQLDPDDNARGRIPDKEAALVLLHDLLRLEPYIPALPPGYSEEAAAGPSGWSPKPPPAKSPLPEHIESKIRRQLQGLKKKK